MLGYFPDFGKATDRRRTARADDIDAAAFRPEFCCAMLRED
jgi:hypothetical protein